MKTPMMLESTSRRILASRCCRSRVQTGVLQRDRGLGREQLQHRDPGRREDPGGQVILEVKHANKLGLVDQGQAENGARPTLTDVRDLR